MKRFILVSAISLFSVSAFSQQVDGLNDEVQSLSDDQKIELIMSSGEAVSLYNFVSESVDTIERVDHLTVQDFDKYIPPIPEIKEFFAYYIDQGMHPYDAYMEAMQEAYELLKQ